MVTQIYIIEAVERNTPIDFYICSIYDILIEL